MNMIQYEYVGINMTRYEYVCMNMTQFGTMTKLASTISTSTTINNNDNVGPVSSNCEMTINNHSFINVSFIYPKLTQILITYMSPLLSFVSHS